MGLELLDKVWKRDFVRFGYLHDFFFSREKKCLLGEVFKDYLIRLT